MGISPAAGCPCGRTRALRSEPPCCGLGLDYQVGADDQGLVESCSAGMQAGALENGRLLLPSEQLNAEFQRWVATGLADR